MPGHCQVEAVDTGTPNKKMEIGRGCFVSFPSTLLKLYRNTVIIKDVEDGQTKGNHKAHVFVVSC